MATYPLTALVLRRTKLGETDLILTLLGSDGALYKAIAKGARRPGSKFGGRAEPATILKALVARGKSLDVISDAKTMVSHRTLREDYEATLAASVILDFAAVTSQESLADTRFYELTVATLETLATCVGQLSRMRTVVTAYLLKAAAMHGYRPDFEADVFLDEEEIEDGGSDNRHTMRRLAYLLGATLGELMGADEETFSDIDTLFEEVRRFVVANIPARLKALEYYATTHM
jgi:DNA repair protein RecO (recombination protein O)